MTGSGRPIVLPAFPRGSARGEDIWTGGCDQGQAEANARDFALTLRHHAGRLVLWVLICLAAGTLYVMTVEPGYIASVRVVLKPRNIALDGSEQERQFRQIDLDGVQAETELRVIRSERVLRYVYDQMALSDDTELQNDRNGLWSALSFWLHRLSVQPTDPDTVDESFSRFNSRVRTMLLGRSYVLDISYLGRSPQQAARIANAIAAAYVGERLRGSSNLQPQATKLNRRIDALRQDVAAVAAAVAGGTLPASDPTDSDIRVLGAAVAPLAKAYPRLAPVLLLAGAIGLCTGLLSIAFLRKRHPSAASQRRLVRSLGADLLHLVPRPRLSWRKRAEWQVSALGSAGLGWRSLVQTGAAGPLAYGVVAWARGGEEQRVAPALESLIASGRREVQRLDLSGLRSGTERAARLRAVLASCSASQTLIVLLPPLEDDADTSDVLPLLDTTVLAVQADRTPLDHVVAGIEAVRAAAAALTVVLLDPDARVAA